MTKREMARELAEKLGYSYKEADVIIDTIFGDRGLILDALARGEEVRMIGLGTFGARSRAARDGFNPMTGERLEIPAKRVPHFRPGRWYREAVEG